MNNKFKIRKSITRRFKITKTGKVLRGSSFARHLKSKKKKSHLRRLKKIKVFEGKMAKKIKMLLGK